MYGYEKYLLTQLTLRSKCISAAEARDIINETQYQINDVLAGENSSYATPEEALADFLDLGPSYLYIFL